MPARILPEGEDLEKEKAFFATASKEQLIERAHKLGFSGLASYKKSLYEEGAKRPRVNEIRPPTSRPLRTADALELLETLVNTRLDQLHQPVPATIPPLKSTRKEEVQVLKVSDAHPGLKTATFNAEVFKQRLKVLRDKTIKICQLHRKIRPVKHLVVFFLGDELEGERIGYQLTLDELEATVLDQIFQIAAPAFGQFLTDLSTEYDTIDCYCVPGNHGSQGKFASSTFNLDTIFYLILQYSLAGNKKIRFQVEGQNFYQVVEVNGWNFLLFHGDQIPSHLGLPFYGLDRRVLRWSQSITQKFDYACCGHFHSANYLEPSGIPMLINGTFVSDDPYALKKLGLGSSCAQWTFFVDKDVGITASYLLRLT